jgi:hypothetical protein
MNKPWKSTVLSWKGCKSNYKTTRRSFSFKKRGNSSKKKIKKPNKTLLRSSSLTKDLLVEVSTWPSEITFLNICFLSV